MNKVKYQTQKHNENMRKVTHLPSYSYTNFLLKSCGDLLINGGMKDKRRQCLIQSIINARDRTNETIYIFSEDDVLQNQLITLAENGRIGQLYVCSEDYPIYDFFSGMREDLISEYFNNLALERGIGDATEINS